MYCTRSCVVKLKPKYQLLFLTLSDNFTISCLKTLSTSPSQSSFFLGSPKILFSELPKVSENFGRLLFGDPWKEASNPPEHPPPPHPLLEDPPAEEHQLGDPLLSPLLEPPDEPGVLILYIVTMCMNGSAVLSVDQPGSVLNVKWALVLDFPIKHAMTHGRYSYIKIYLRRVENIEYAAL